MYELHNGHMPLVNIDIGLKANGLTVRIGKTLDGHDVVTHFQRCDLTGILAIFRRAAGHDRFAAPISGVRLYQHILVAFHRTSDGTETVGFLHRLRTV